MGCICKHDPLGWNNQPLPQTCWCKQHRQATDQSQDCNRVNDHQTYVQPWRWENWQSRFNAQRDDTGTRNNKSEKFLELINTLFKAISYIIADNKEKYFHSIFYIIVKLPGFTIETEVMTIDGTIDAVITTNNYIYIVEFKAGQDAPKAVEQIRQKGYNKKYAADKRPKTLIGINFDMERKCIDDYVIEQVK